MNERLLILAAIKICPVKGPNAERTIEDAIAAVKTYRESTIKALKSDALFESTRKWYETDLADCDLWLAASKGLEDAPIADPVERAKAVAKALRDDGIYATIVDDMVECAQWPGWGFDVSRPGTSKTGIKAITQSIKALLIDRAKSQAGDK